MCSEITNKKHPLQTGIKYKLINNVGFYQKGLVGELIDCPISDPIILQFGHGLREVFRARDIVKVSSDIPVTKLSKTKPRYKARFLTKKQKLLYYKIYEILLKSKDWITTSELTRIVGAPVSYSLGINFKKNPQRSFLALGLIERHPARNKPHKWKLTLKGRSKGAEIIREL